MIIWVFVARITLAGQSIDMAAEMKYAFVSRDACEHVIQGSKTLHCIPLILVEK